MQQQKLRFALVDRLRTCYAPHTLLSHQQAARAAATLRIACAIVQKQRKPCQTRAVVESGGHDALGAVQATFCSSPAGRSRCESRKRRAAALAASATAATSPLPSLPRLPALSRTPSLATASTRGNASHRRACGMAARLGFADAIPQLRFKQPRQRPEVARLAGVARTVVHLALPQAVTNHLQRSRGRCCVH